MKQSFKDRANALLDTEMDRAGFLKLCAVILVSAVGIGGLVSLLAHRSTNKTTAATSPTFGYGGRAPRG